MSTPKAPTPDLPGHSRLLAGIITAIVFGAVVGGWLPQFGLKFQILGDMFLNTLMMLVVPLVMLSMIAGITGLGDIRKLGSIGWRTLAYYMATTLAAVSIGLALVNIVRPGAGVSPGETHPTSSYVVGGANRRTVTLTDDAWEQLGYTDQYVVTLLDQGVRGTLRSIRDNSVTVSLWERLEPGDVVYITAEDGTRLPFRREQGQLVSREPELSVSGTGIEIGLPLPRGLGSGGDGDIATTLREVLLGSEESGKQGLIPRNVFAAMANVEILPLIVFSLLLGAALSVLGRRVQPTVDAITNLSNAVMQLVHWVMYVAPIGIFGLVAARIGQAGGFSGFVPQLVALGKYAGTVMLGLVVHGFVVLPLILALIGKRRPVPYLAGVGAALLNAFSTSSSSATLPLTLQGVREENGVSNRTASFVLPLGATINMDGTALYESVAAVFIAQVYGIPLSPAMQAVIFLTATLAAIGAAGIPEAGLVTMVIVLNAVGLPLEGIGLILTIDWLLDRFRTTVNVWGDSIGAGVIETLEMRPPEESSGSDVVPA